MGRWLSEIPKKVETVFKKNLNSKTYYPKNWEVRGKKCVMWFHMVFKVRVIGLFLSLEVFF